MNLTVKDTYCSRRSKIDVHLSVPEAVSVKTTDLVCLKSSDNSSKTDYVTGTSLPALTNSVKVEVDFSF